MDLIICSSRINNINLFLEEYKNNFPDNKYKLLVPAHLDEKIQNEEKIIYNYDKFISVQKTPAEFFLKINQYNFNNIYILVYTNNFSIYDFIENWNNIIEFVLQIKAKKYIFTNLAGDKYNISKNKLKLFWKTQKIKYLLSPIIVYEGIKFDYFNKSKNKENFIGCATNYSINTYYNIYKNKIKSAGYSGICLKSDAGLPNNLFICSNIKWIISKIGFQNYNFLSLIIFIITIIFGSIIYNNLFFIIFIPYILNSKYFKISYLISHPVLSGWALTLFSIILLDNNYFILSAIILAIIFLYRLNVGIISIGITFLFWLTKFSLIQFVNYYLIFFLLVLWWLIPFIRNLKYFSHIKITKVGPHFSENVIQHYVKNFKDELIAIIIFILAGIITIKNLEIIILFIPLMINLNIILRKKFLVGNYTTTMCFLITSLFLTIKYFNPFLFLIFIISINYGKNICSSEGFSFGSKYYFANDKFSKFVNLFNNNKRTRLLIEMDEDLANFAYSYLIDYLLFNKEIEVFPGSASVEGRAEIYLNYCKKFNPKTMIDELEKICLNGSFEYLIIFTKEMEEKINSYKKLKYEKIGEYNTEEIGITHLASKKILLYKSTENLAIIEEGKNVAIKDNYISFDCEKEKEYKIKYAYYKGWQAYNNNKPIKIEEIDDLWMKVKAIEDGKIELKYSYLNYYKII